MATIATHSGNLPTPSRLTAQMALRYAWYVWLVMLVCPFFLFLYAIWSSVRSPAITDNQWLADRWFIASVLYMIVVPSASFFIRSRWFAPYWKGDCVPPRDYLKGMFTVWGALELGGIVSLAGCIASGAILPNLLPALAAFTMFVIMWPNGRAMACGGRGASDDPERYEEPR